MILSLDETQLKIKTVKQTGEAGTFTLGPLPPNYGATAGNALRRVLLSSLRGAAIAQAKFDGVPHQFDTISGVKEDVMELILNLKGVRLRMADDAPAVLLLNKKGPGEVVAGDIQTPAGVEIVNKDFHLASLADKKSELKAELVAETGRGFAIASESEAKVGVIPLDTLFSPVSSVSYKVEPTRVGRVSGYDQLTIDITTDRTIKPYDALLEAAGVLERFFARIAEGEKTDDEAAEPNSTALPETRKDLSLEDLDLPVRLLNSLKRARIKTVGDLLAKSSDGLLKIKNIGPASLKDIEKALKKEGF